MKKGSFKILDCTLRDGGYYTNWDFDQSLVEQYIASVNLLAIDYVEVGYRSNSQSGYLGEYRYLPERTLKRLSDSLADHVKLAVMIDLKDTAPADLEHLISPVKAYVDMVRIAVAPDQMAKGVELAKLIKLMGLEVAFNIMYLSHQSVNDDIVSLLNSAAAYLDYVYLVDSFGSNMPADIETIYSQASSLLSVPLGFHGHNNMEMALANSLTAADNGAVIIDATMTGMGRGAGNLKTELFLTYLKAKCRLQIDSSALSAIVNEFSALKASYNWGTSLPYMISGAYALPQKEVMSMLAKKRYTVSTIVKALINVTEDKAKPQLAPFNKQVIPNYSEVMIVGGGQSVSRHAHQIEEYLRAKPDMLIIHSSSRNLGAFVTCKNPQVLCLAGDEDKKLTILEAKGELKAIDAYIMASPEQEVMTYIKEQLNSEICQVESMRFESDLADSPLALALSGYLGFDSQAPCYLVGFDGYQSVSSAFYLKEETQAVIDAFNDMSDQKLISLTLSSYKSLDQQSIYQP